MRHQLRTAAILAAASLALSACTDATNQAPTAPNTKAIRPTNASGSLAAATCDVTTLRSYVKDYAKSNKDPLYAILSDIQKNGPSNDKAFDGLSRVAAIRGTADQNTGVAGSVFDGLVRGLLGCASSDVLAGALEDLPNGSFGDALTASKGWLFEVRGKNAEPPLTGPYKAGPYDDPTTTAYQRAGANPSTWWAVDPNPSDASVPQLLWNRSITSSGSPALPKRFLIYGFPTNEFLSNVNGALSPFELRTIPRICPVTTGSDPVSCTSPTTTFGISLKVGLCWSTVPDLANLRLNHDNVFVAKATLTCLDPNPITVASASTGFGAINAFAMATRRIANFFAPQTAYAFGGGLSGAVKDLSPVAVYDLSQVLLDSLGTIADGKVSAELKTTTALAPYGTHVVVQARSKAATGMPSTPLEGVSIEMSIAGNSSTIAFFNTGTGPDSVTVTRKTDARGFADFGGVRLTKAGGYQLAFRVAFDGVFGTPYLSNSFNYQNK